MSFTEIFGGTTIYPAQQSYLSLTVIADVDLSWPIEQQMGGYVVADIIDISAAAPGFNINIPDARQVSTGFTSLFNNVGANTVTILDAGGGTIVSLVSGSCWQAYLTDNSTEAGTWRTFQFGASVSVADAAALAGAGLVAITTTLNQSMPTSEKAVSYVILEADRARLIIWTSGTGTFTLPSPASVGAGWFVGVRNSGSGDLTVSPVSGLIDGAATLTVAAGNSAFVITNGTDWFTLGLSTSSTGGSGFNYLSINVSGTGNYTLAGAELNRIGYNFTGVLSGNRNIVVPAASQEYWVTNSTTGAFDLFVKTAVQAVGIQILPGDSNILYCDGADVKSAESSTVSFPIAVNQGGTGATTAATARTNLGATTVGSNVFTAANSAAALSAIGGASASLTLTAGNGITGGGDLSANRSFAVNNGTGLVFSGGAVLVDRTGTDGLQVGYLDVFPNAQTVSYGLVLTDRGKQVVMNNTSLTVTIPANASIAFPLGSVIQIVNLNSTVVTIAITTDTLRMAGTSSTGTRTLVQYGVAYVLKIATTQWLVSGVGLG